MRTRRKFRFAICILSLISLAHCSNDQYPSPPPAFIVIHTYYQNDKGHDLLNASTTNSFKAKDLVMVSSMNINGAVKDIEYSVNMNGGTSIFVDPDARSYIPFCIPTKEAGKTPLASFITLSASVTDTITYSFSTSYVPDQIFYNKKLVWKLTDAPRIGDWQPITIIK